MIINKKKIIKKIINKNLNKTGKKLSWKLGAVCNLENIQTSMVEI